MSDYDKLEEEFDKKVKLLQQTCKHKDIESTKAFSIQGYQGDKKIKVCLNCNRMWDDE